MVNLPLASNESWLETAESDAIIFKVAVPVLEVGAMTTSAAEERTILEEADTVTSLAALLPRVTSPVPASIWNCVLSEVSDSLKLPSVVVVRLVRQEVVVHLGRRGLRCGHQVGGSNRPASEAASEAAVAGPASQAGFP